MPYLIVNILLIYKVVSAEECTGYTILYVRSDNRKGKLFAKSNFEKIKVKDFETFFAPEGQF